MEGEEEGGGDSGGASGTLLLLLLLAPLDAAAAGVAEESDPARMAAVGCTGWGAAMGALSETGASDSAISLARACSMAARDSCSTTPNPASVHTHRGAAASADPVRPRRWRNASVSTYCLLLLMLAALLLAALLLLLAASTGSPIDALLRLANMAAVVRMKGCGVRSAEADRGGRHAASGQSGGCARRSPTISAARRQQHTLQLHLSRAPKLSPITKHSTTDSQKRMREKGPKNFFDSAETASVPLQIATEPSAQSAWK